MCIVVVLHLAICVAGVVNVLLSFLYGKNSFCTKGLVYGDIV